MFGSLRYVNVHTKATSRKLSYSFNAVRICVWVRPAVVLSHGATLAVDRRTELFLPLQRFAGTPNSGSNSKLAFQAFPVRIRVWIRPAVVWSPWETLPLGRCTEFILLFQSLSSFPNSLYTQWNVPSKLSSQEWLLAPSSYRMIALGDAAPLEMPRVHPASS